MKKFIFISGVSTGIGYATSKLLINKGFYVIGTVRKEADKVRLKEELGSKFHTVILDVEKSVQIQKALPEINSILDGQHLTALVNNAGYAQPGPLLGMKEEDFQRQLNVNVTGVFRLTNALLPLLGASIDTEPKGKIIMISSISGLFNMPFNGAYCISKHALESMTDIYRRELLIYDIDVIAIEPGPIKTEIWQKAIGFEHEIDQGDYKPWLQNASKMIEKTEEDALPVSRVSELIHDVINNPSPKTRYIVHKTKKRFWFVSKFVPDRWVDKMIKKQLSKQNKIRPV